MGAKEDGGLAFPMHEATTLREARGMSLRDWLAGQVAAGMASYSGTAGVSYGPSEIAGRSYEVADAMLVARQKESS